MSKMTKEQQARFKENTKAAVKQVLEKYITFTDSFVETLFQEYPEKFAENEMVHGDELINPFDVLKVMNTYMNIKFDTFTKEIYEMNNEPKPQQASIPENLTLPDNVVNFSGVKKNPKKEEMN